MSAAALDELVLATRNDGKLREMRQLTAGLPFVWRGLDDFPAVPEAVEDAETFVGNATRKALHYAEATGLAALADDSGLEVDALGGAPGVHSARFAGASRDDAANNRKLISALAGTRIAERTARFCCAMVLARGGEVLHVATGVLHGLILDEARGENGFGYDPHFFVPALGRRTAELAADQKNAISHRGRALRGVAVWLETRR